MQKKRRTLRKSNGSCIVERRPGWEPFFTILLVTREQGPFIRRSWDTIAGSEIRSRLRRNGARPWANPTLVSRQDKHGCGARPAYRWPRAPEGIQGCVSCVRMPRRNRPSARLHLPVTGNFGARLRGQLAMGVDL